MSLFAVILIVYFTTELFDFVVLGFAFFILVLVPLALRKGETYEVLVLTPEMLIQQTTPTDVIAIAFDDIKKFGTDKNGVFVKDSKSTISLDPSVLADSILILIEILEAKGKTFDKSKDYMIRPIEIIIENDEIKIKDIEQEETLTEKLVSENYKDYSMLTPGFLTDIILMNSVVEDSHIENENLFINLNRFEVNPGHPENTLFESQMANDCIMIFENVVIESITKKESRGTEEEVIEPELNKLIAQIEKGVISDWKYSKNKIDLQFSVDLHIIRTSFTYEDVIIGWNTFN